MLYGKSAAETARDSHIVPVNERDYVLNGYIGASPVRGHYVEARNVPWKRDRECRSSLAAVQEIGRHRALAPDVHDAAGL